MFFAVFYHANLSGQLSPTCGSDGVVQIDGRFSKERASAAAREQAHRLRFVKPGLLGFQLFKGESYSRCSPVSGLRPISEAVLPDFHDAKEKGVVAW
jgi:hypothetical protein